VDEVITVQLLRSPQDIDVMYELKIEQTASQISGEAPVRWWRLAFFVGGCYWPRRGIWRSGSMGWNLRIGRVKGTETSGTFTILAHRGVRSAWRKVG
jgi:hypothetical protein